MKLYARKKQEQRIFYNSEFSLQITIANIDKTQTHPDQIKDNSGVLTHLPLVRHIYVTGSGQHWLK